jgi:cell division septal protein FtsQ
VSPVAVPPDRRFRRAHVKPARTRRHWQTLAGRSMRSVLLAALLVYAAYRVPGIVARTPGLKIDRILVHGNEHLSTADVLALLNGLRGQSVISTDLNVWRGRMLRSPWVSEVEFRRSLPSTVDVFLSEKTPVGIARIDGRMYLIDEYGGVIDEYGPHYAEIDLPVIDGLSAPSGGGASGNQPRVELAAQVIAALKSKPDVGRRLSQIDVHDLHNAAVILSGDAAVIQLGDRDFLQRLQSYLEVAPELRARVVSIDHVDVRFDGRIYVKPMGKPSKPAMASARAR